MAADKDALIKELKEDVKKLTKALKEREETIKALQKVRSKLW